MVFSSLFFLFAFLPTVLILFYLTRSSFLRNWLLIVASLLFYAWGEPVWVTLLLISAFSAYFFGQLITKYRGSRLGNVYLVIAIVFNLSILAFFKYVGMAVESLNILFAIHIPYQEIGLPIGISFFTFQTISYVVDTYRGNINGKRSLTEVLLYTTLFPQLVAGPIVRFTEIQQQLAKRTLSAHRFAKGASLFIIGLGKKVILANTVGETAALFLDGGVGQPSVLGAWFGISLFALQIYFDFSGYSDMAIGLGKMFGFDFPKNFNYPYASRSASEFWRRWNMTLGRFFRDYVYIPLGGNKRFFARNLFVVWFLTGLWHGASWNFVIWGLFFGCFIYLERKGLSALLDKAPRVVSHLYATLIMLVGWVFFYFTDLRQALDFLGLMFGLDNSPLTTLMLVMQFKERALFFLLAVLASLPLARTLILWTYRKLSRRTMRLGYAHFILPTMHLLIFWLAIAFLAGDSYNPFLYFRF